MTAMWALAHALGIAENLVNILGFSHNDSLIYKNNNNNNNNGYNQYQRKYYILEVQIQQISKKSDLIIWVPDDLVHHILHTLYFLFPRNLHGHSCQIKIYSPIRISVIYSWKYNCTSKWHFLYLYKKIINRTVQSAAEGSKLHMVQKANCSRSCLHQ